MTAHFHRRRLIEIAVLAGILVLAAATRLPGLDQRGPWDSDQGHDMRVLAALVERGEVPLLGPPTSIGTFHHGAAYYALLAPAALVSGADPVAVTREIALLGIGAVAAAWWLGRLVGGRAAAAVAGLLTALSPSGIDESTFIWNPNPIPLAAALAFAGALVAWRSGRARWWLLAGLGAMLTMQLHVLGLVVVPPLVAAWIADVRRRRSDGRPRRPAVLAGAGALAIIAAGYVPLVIHELTSDFSETRAIVAYLAGGGGGGGVDVATRVLIVGLRAATWPIAGLVTDRPAGTVLALASMVGLSVAAIVLARREDRAPAAWLAWTLGWSVVALAVAAPSLATITPGLPNDHYHAFLDPVVLALVGVGLARLASVGAPGRGAANPESHGGPGRGAVTPGRLAAGALAVLLAGIAITSWPPAVAPDGGWPLADASAAEVLDITGDRQIRLDGIPPFKSADALRFPLERRGADVTTDVAGTQSSAYGDVVLVCDPLFDEVVGAACGGPAEDRWIAETPGLPKLGLERRIDAGPRRVISIYAVAGAP